MKRYNATIFTLLLLLLFNGLNVFAKKHSNLPPKGVYDGFVAEKKLILMVDKTSETYAAGTYIYVRNNLFEEPITFTFIENNGKLEFKSDSITGRFKGTITDCEITGKIRDPKFHFFPWKRNTKINFVKRAPFDTPILNRYIEPVFDSVDVQTDFIYGRGKGYWTETPYLDNAYISIVAKGLVNFFKGQTMLDLKLDIYQPAGDLHTNRPLLLLTHGGGFYIGNKQSETERLMANWFTKLGYVVASIDYRMGFRFKGGDIERSGYKAIQDVHAALRYLSHHAKELRIDPNQVFLAGTSAGAIASLNVAFLDNSERPKTTYAYLLKKDLGDIETGCNNYTETFDVKAVMNMWGAITDTLYIDPEKNIPVISFYGDQDDIVPFDHDYPFKNTLTMNRYVMDKMFGSIPIHQRLENLGIRNKIIVFKDKGHEPQLTYFKIVNDLMDIIIEESTNFISPINIPFFKNNEDDWVIETNKAPQPLHIPVSNGYFGHFELEGGVTMSPNPNESRVIWFKSAPNYSASVWITNDFDAWEERDLNLQFK